MAEVSTYFESFRVIDHKSIFATPDKFNFHYYMRVNIILLYI